MKCPRPLVLVFVVLSSTVKSMPLELTTTVRSPQQIGETIKQVTNQLMETNATSSDVITLDTRTPPRIKQHAKKKNKPEMFENSHAGVAIPIDEEAINLEETTKKLNFYKIERPTTNGGLSTWILLSGSSTTKPPKRPTIKPSDDMTNLTMISDFINKNKPLFKKRPSNPTTTTTTTITTQKPSTTQKITTEATKVTTTISITKNPKETTKLTKIKASVLNNAVKKITTISPPSTKKNPSSITIKTTTIKSFTEPTHSDNKNITINENQLSMEAKDGEVDLANNSSDKNKKSTKRPVTNKRKKNKNRRRRPATDKSDGNSTKIEKPTKIKEKPIGTQLYNYLSREVMPTVGVGLVGLMVTAGLASYFLYPFGVARRSYDIDRKDKEGSYYYNDEYSGGIAEEEAIGKVIAGMPANTLFGNKYKTPSSRIDYGANDNNNNRIKQVEHRISGGYLPQQLNNNYEDSYSTQNNYDNPYQPINYNNKEIFEQSKETGYIVSDDDKKFVVGSIPKDVTDEVTPAVVPEHGPRSLKLRKKRDASSSPTVDEKDNEIGSSFDSSGDNLKNKVEEIESTTSKNVYTTTTIITTSTTTPKSTQTTTARPDKVVSFIHLMKDLFHLKINLGLQLIQNATQSISRYVSKVQKRLDEHYRNYTRTRQWTF